MLDTVRCNPTTAMASTLQQPRKRKKANRQGEGKASRRKHHPKGNVINAQKPVSSGASSVSKEQDNQRASKWSQGGKEESKHEDTNLDTTQGVHVDKQV